MSFRIAVLPIENEIHSECGMSSNVDESHAEEGTEGTEEMRGKLNIDKAQDCYKRDYDMIHSNGKVSWQLEFVVLMSFFLNSQFKLEKWFC